MVTLAKGKQHLKKSNSNFKAHYQKDGNRLIPYSISETVPRAGRALYPCRWWKLQRFWTDILSELTALILTMFLKPKSQEREMWGYFQQVLYLFKHLPTAGSTAHFCILAYRVHHKMILWKLTACFAILNVKAMSNHTKILHKTYTHTLYLKDMK